MKDRSIFWMALFSVVVSILTIILFFIKVDENSVVNSSTFISACTAIITIGVTLAIGFQVFQSLDIKSKLADIKKLEQDLKNARIEFQLITADLKSTMLYDEGDRLWNKGDIFNAILKQQEAIDVYLRSDLNKDVVESWIEILKTYVEGIEIREKKVNEKLDKLLIESFKLQWRHNTISLEHNPNYWAIAKSYKKIQQEVNKKISSLNNDQSR